MKTNLLQKNIPKGWQIKKIKNLLDFEQPTKYIVESSSYTSDGKTPVLTANKSFVLGYTNETDGVYTNTPAIIFDDFTTDSKYVDFPFKIKSSAIKILTNRDENTDLKFVYEIMKSFNFPIANHKRHYISQYQELDIVVPLVNEQKKIAEILSSVDSYIEKIDEDISNTEKLKSGLTIRFFTKGLNDRKLSKDKLGNLLNLVIDRRGITPKKLGGEWSDAGVPAISAMNVKNGKIVKPETIRYVSESLYKRWMSEDLVSGDVILTSEAPLGETYLVNGERFCLSQRLFGLRTDKQKISGEYLFHFLNSPVGQKKLYARATGTTAKGIRQSELLKVEIDYPNEFASQKKIVEVISAIDKKIDLYREIKTKFVFLKKGLVSDLLSGSKRVKI